MLRRKLLIGGAAAATLVTASCTSGKKSVVDHIVVNKSKRQMILYRGRTIMAKYRIHLGFNPIGHKRREGDGKTPEGVYKIGYKNPNSDFYKSLFITYPNQADRQYAAQRGWNPGGAIFIHGGPRTAANKNKRDWTAGCIAVTDREMDTIYRITKVGAKITINP